MRDGVLSRIACGCFGILFASWLHAQEAAVPEVTVEADRLPNEQLDGPLSVEVVDSEELKRAPQVRLDDILRAEVPGFSLFRRSSSRVANPTTQGVTLRNFGPNGAGRTLVLLDGIPVNDPFAGYVQWDQLPPASLDRILVVPGGGAGLFGNAALAGTIFLLSKEPAETSRYGTALVGNANTYSAAVGGDLVNRPVSFSFFAERFFTGGYPVLQSDQRGSVDNSASADSEVFQLGSEFQLGRDVSLSLQARGFHELRGNGTIYTENETDAGDVSVTLTTRFPEFSAELKLSSYFQARKYRSTFSSVNAARDVETPALDQFRVPANAAGGSAVWSMAIASQHAITFGGDARWVEGETNENFRFMQNEFTRTRVAGGQQLFAGIFAEDTWKASETVTLTGAVRADRWQLYDGLRRETDRQTGTVNLESRFADHDGSEFNGRIGGRVNLTNEFKIHSAVYTGFRVPTLNELYRPFRVGNDVTEANAELQPERLIGGEAGLDWQVVRTLHFSGTAFYNRMEDAVGNITIGMGPGTFDPGGFIPAGGVLRQRRNIDLVTAPGFELAADWAILPTVFVRLNYLFSSSTISQAEDRRLNGNLLAQTPEHSLAAALEWRVAPRWLITTQARYVGRQFEDDQNAIALAPFTVVDAAVRYEWTEKVAVALKIENLLDREIETGKSAGGLVSIGNPRLVTFQLQWNL